MSEENKKGFKAGQFPATKEGLIAYLTEYVKEPLEKDKWEINPSHEFNLLGENTNQIRCELHNHFPDKYTEEFSVILTADTLNYHASGLQWFYRCDGGWNEGWDFEERFNKTDKRELSSEEKDFIRGVMEALNTPEQVKKYEASACIRKLEEERATARREKRCGDYMRCALSLGDSKHMAFLNAMGSIPEKFRSGKNLEERIKNEGLSGYIFRESPNGSWSIYETTKKTAVLEDLTVGELREDEYALIEKGDTPIFGEQTFIRVVYDEDRSNLNDYNKGLHTAVISNDSIHKGFVSKLAIEQEMADTRTNENTIHPGAISINSFELAKRVIYFEHGKIMDEYCRENDFDEEDDWPDLTGKEMDELYNDYYENSNIVIEVALDDSGRIHAYVSGGGDEFCYPNEEGCTEIPLTETEKRYLEDKFGEELAKNKEDWLED